MLHTVRSVQCMFWLSLVSLCVLSTSVKAVDIVFPAYDSYGKKIAKQVRGDLVTPATLETTLQTKNITYTIRYDDPVDTGGDDEDAGFLDNEYGPMRRDCLKDVLVYIADVLNIPDMVREPGVTGPAILDVRVRQSLFIDSPIAAKAGSPFPGAPGFQDCLTFYRLYYNEKRNEEWSEIIISYVNFGAALNVESGAPAFNEYDLRTLLLHEFTHGLGFISLLNETGGSIVADGTYSSYDAFLVENTSGTDIFTLLGSSLDVLTGDDVAWNAPNASAVYGERPPIYSPATFLQGTSISHWDPLIEDTTTPVMAYQIITGQQRRTYDPIEIAALIDIGYTAAAAADETPGQEVNPLLTIVPNEDPENLEGAVDGTKSFDITIANNGGGTITGTVFVSGEGFALADSPTYSVDAYDYEIITINFTPEDPEEYTATVTITDNNDPGNPTIINITANANENTTPQGCQQKLGESFPPDPGTVLMGLFTIIAMLVAHRFSGPIC